jgi:hypothetical protein
MILSARAALAGALLPLLCVPAPVQAASGASIVAAACARNDALSSYTFHLNVAMAMRHFPWLHFRMEGVGEYRRGERYKVHFTKMPPFAGKIHDIDLSMIDPSMWPGRYTYEEIAKQDGNAVFALQGIDGNSLKEATVALSPDGGPQWVDVTYDDGTHIHMKINSNDLDGFLLPSSLDADVDYPHMPLSANANFTDYSFVPPAR